jgi:hypothetical protein
MHALDDLAHAGLDACLVAQIGDILACLADNHAGLLGRHDSSQGQLSLGILLVRLGRRLAVGAKAGFVVELELVKLVGELAVVLGMCFL